MSLFYKIIILIAVLVVIALFVGYSLFLQNQSPKDLSKVSDSQIVSLLDKNADAKDYMKNHADFKINRKEVLTKESIISGQKAANFKEVYQGLELQNNRYLRVDLINAAGDRGLLAVLDFKTDQTIKAYGIILLQAGVK